MEKMEKQESQEILTDEKTIRFFFPKFLFYGYGILGLLIYLTFCGFDKVFIGVGVLLLCEAVSMWNNDPFSILFFLVMEVFSITFFFSNAMFTVIMMIYRDISFSVTIDAATTFISILTFSTFHCFMVYRIYRYTKKNHENIEIFSNDRCQFIFEV